VSLVVPATMVTGFIWNLSPHRCRNWLKLSAHKISLFKQAELCNISLKSVEFGWKISRWVVFTNSYRMNCSRINQISMTRQHKSKLSQKIRWKASASLHQSRAKIHIWGKDLIGHRFPFNCKHITIPMMCCFFHSITFSVLTWAAMLHFHWLGTFSGKYEFWCWCGPDFPTLSYYVCIVIVKIFFPKFCDIKN
jgi:hypothetical protein